MADLNETLRNEYVTNEALAKDFAVAIADQIQHLLDEEGLRLGVPVQTRVKSWSSIAKKLERKAMSLEHIKDLSDLVGVRLIFLFSRDVEKTCHLVSKSFKLIEQENTMGRLREDQFGYQSLHLTVQTPSAWLRIPSLKRFAGWRAEVQIRTLAQHIWADASHRLQYKNETGVPLPVLRSIYRLSALLEIADLELERVLGTREVYLQQEDDLPADEPLNVDAVRMVISRSWPIEYQMNNDDDNYASLLEELLHFDINTVAELRTLVSDGKDAAIARDQELVARCRDGKPNWYEGGADDWDRVVQTGRLYNQIGLTRHAISHRVGKEKFEDYLQEKALMQETAGDS